MIIVLVSGRAGVGKDTFAYQLGYELNIIGVDSATIHFADSLKEVAQKDFGWDGKKDSLGRKLLQDIGKVGRAYNQRIWSRRAMLKISAMEREDFVKDNRVYIIPDWRFPDEYAEVTEFYPRALVLKVRIQAPEREQLRGMPTYDDESEVSLPEDNKLFYDYTLDNSGSIGFLYIKAREIANTIKAYKDKE